MRQRHKRNPEYYLQQEHLFWAEVRLSLYLCSHDLKVVAIEFRINWALVLIRKTLIIFLPLPDC